MRLWPVSPITCSNSCDPKSVYYVGALDAFVLDGIQLYRPRDAELKYQRNELTGCHIKIIFQL